MEPDKQLQIMVAMNDDMQECAAYRRAIKLGEMSGASIHVFMFVYHPALDNLRATNPDIANEVINAHVATRRAWLEQRMKAMWDGGIEIVSHVEWARMRAGTILEKVANLEPDLVIKEIQATSALRRAFLTPLDWELLRFCPAQLMLVRSDGAARPRRVIAAVDVMDSHNKVSELNDAIVTAASRLASDCRSDFDLIHVFQFLPMSNEIPLAGSMATDLWARLYDEMREEQRSAFTKFVARHGIASAQSHFLEKPLIETAIEDYAEKHHADVLVLGTAYRTGVDRFLIGSTAERLLSHTPCDLLVVKSAGHQKLLRSRR